MYGWTDASRDDLRLLLPQLLLAAVLLSAPPLSTSRFAVNEAGTILLSLRLEGEAHQFAFDTPLRDTVVSAQAAQVLSHGTQTISPQKGSMT